MREVLDEDPVHPFPSLPFLTAFFAGASAGDAFFAGAFAPVLGPEGIFAPYLAWVVRAPGMAYSAFGLAATFVDGRGWATGCFFASFARFCFWRRMARCLSALICNLSVLGTALTA